MYTSTEQQPMNDGSSCADNIKLETPADSNDKATGCQRTVGGFIFEEQLMKFRPYKPARGEEIDAFSILSSAGRTASWSMVSGLSLSEVSQVAVLAIPIYATDISNKDAYDFETAPSLFMPGLSSQEGLSTPDRESRNRGSRRQRLKGLVPLLRRAGSSRADTLLVNEQPREMPGGPFVFGVRLEKSIKYARAHINFTDGSLQQQAYGYIPLVVASAAGFLKHEGKPFENTLPIRFSKISPLAVPSDSLHPSY